MSAKEAAHKGAGWAGVALAAITMGTVYLERDTAKLQSVQAAATAQVNIEDEFNDTIDEVEDGLAVCLSLHEERDRRDELLLDRVEELERRHRIRTDRAEPVARVLDLPPDAVGPPPRAPTPRDILKEMKRKKPRPKKRDRYEAAQQTILEEAFK